MLPHSVRRFQLWTLTKTIINHLFIENGTIFRCASQHESIGSSVWHRTRVLTKVRETGRGSARRSFTIYSWFTCRTFRSSSEEYLFVFYSSFEWQCKAPRIPECVLHVIVLFTVSVAGAHCPHTHTQTDTQNALLIWHRNRNWSLPNAVVLGISFLFVFCVCIIFVGECDSVSTSRVRLEIFQVNENKQIHSHFHENVLKFYQRRLDTIWRRTHTHARRQKEMKTRFCLGVKCATRKRCRW